MLASRRNNGEYHWDGKEGQTAPGQACGEAESPRGKRGGAAGRWRRNGWRRGEGDRLGRGGNTWRRVPGKWRRGAGGRNRACARERAGQKSREGCFRGGKGGG